MSAKLPALGPDALAAYHLLTFPPIAARCRPYTKDHYAIDIEGLLLQSKKWSSGERALVELALSLWSDCHTVNLWRTLGSLDGAWGERAIEAIALYLRNGRTEPFVWPFREPGKHEVTAEAT